MNCTAKHTKYQPTDEEWSCPKCGDSEWFVYDRDESAVDECGKIHSSDVLFCEKCNHSETGQAFALRLQRKQKLVPCPHCKGSGLVKKGE